MRVLICDDEQIIVEQIRSMIESHFPGYEVTGIKGSKELFELLNKNSDLVFDVVFLDLVLREESGINLGMFISRKMPDAKIIFVSGHIEKVQEIFFSVKPYGFITKPIEPIVLYRHIANIEDELAREDKSFDYYIKGKRRTLRFADILYVESDRNKILIHSVNEDITIIDRLDNIEKTFPKSFIRCHKSYFVNMKYVVEYNKTNFILINSHSINISRSKKDEVERRYFAFKGGMV